MKQINVQFPSNLRFLLPLKPKYSPQQPILEHPLSMSFPYYEKSSYTPIQDNRQKNISI